MLTLIDPDYRYPLPIRVLTLIAIAALLILSPILIYNDRLCEYTVSFLAWLFAIIRGLELYKYSKNRTIIHLATNLLIFSTIGAYLGIAIYWSIKLIS